MTVFIQPPLESLSPLINIRRKLVQPPNLPTVSNVRKCRAMMVLMKNGPPVPRLFPCDVTPCTQGSSAVMLVSVAFVGADPEMVEDCDDSPSLHLAQLIVEHMQTAALLVAARMACSERCHHSGWRQRQGQLEIAPMQRVSRDLQTVASLGLAYGYRHCRGPWRNVEEYL